ncbi:TIGR02391 family protein [Streptomyces sp. 136MFCol5.1]|uniref:TIGR02391 family protein n=1 Tax=Streptomyces sp. 136MFCol5.1 TaxID=1172182 RepID=UPI0008830961|nr:TIGR02391 family protein [Streptomyces sp. 136MFCol5.1]SCZ16680.1 TIGR02391 family protein [Streptomyces sp. 136MFCol5.1]
MIVRTIAPEGMPRPTGEEGHILLAAIWAYFSERHRWPTFDDIDRKLFAQGLDFEEVVQQLCPALLLGLSPDISQLPQGMHDLSLSVAGAANCTGTGPALAVFLNMVRTAAGMEPAWLPADRGDSPWMQPGDLAPIPGIDPALLSEEVTFAAAALGQRETCFGGGSINREGLDWSLSFDRTIRPFADVHRVDDYWRIREQVQGPQRAEADRRPFAKRPTLHTVAMLVAPPPAPAVPAGDSPEPMSVTCNLHPLIAEVAAERYVRGAYNDAVRSAFQAVEHRVHTMVPPTTLVGHGLMGYALNANSGEPLITVTRSTGNSLDSERRGMQDLFKGSMQALRNPRSHGPDERDDRDEAEEMLVIASFLMRRLDIEDDKRKAAAAAPASQP